MQLRNDKCGEQRRMQPCQSACHSGITVYKWGMFENTGLGHIRKKTSGSLKKKFFLKKDTAPMFFLAHFVLMPWLCYSFGFFSFEFRKSCNWTVKSKVQWRDYESCANCDVLACTTIFWCGISFYMLRLHYGSGVKGMGQGEHITSVVSLAYVV